MFSVIISKRPCISQNSAMLYFIKNKQSTYFSNVSDGVLSQSNHKVYIHMQRCSRAGMHQNGIPVNILAPERRFGKKVSSRPESLYNTDLHSVLTIWTHHHPSNYLITTTPLYIRTCYTTIPHKGYQNRFSSYFLFFLLIDCVHNYMAASFGLTSSLYVQ